jgi:hypothetical protein
MGKVYFQEYNLQIVVNQYSITTVRIGRHYQLKHGHYLNDQIILELVQSLDGETFKVDSHTNGVDYYVADIVHVGTDTKKRIYRVIWIFEGDAIDVLGVVNAYRRKGAKKEKKHEK